jgi:hypothetical protein
MDHKRDGKKEELDGRSLIDMVFSWSLRDVLNKDLHKNQVFCFFLTSEWLFYIVRMLRTDTLIHSSYMT